MLSWFLLISCEFLWFSIISCWILFIFIDDQWCSIIFFWFCVDFNWFDWILSIPIGFLFKHLSLLHFNAFSLIFISFQWCCIDFSWSSECYNLVDFWTKSLLKCTKFDILWLFGPERVWKMLKLFVFPRFTFLSQFWWFGITFTAKIFFLLIVYS